jgi:hypothetical protein
MTANRPTLFVKRQGSTLVPYARFDQELLAKFREGVRLRADITERRSAPRNRLYWSILKAVCDATGRWPNSEALHTALKLNLGIVDTVASVHGEPIILPGSTAFKALDEAQFREFFDAACLLISTDICPGLTIEDLLSLGRARLGPDERSAA